jgi:hypothetical protein
METKQPNMTTFMTCTELTRTKLPHDTPHNHDNQKWSFYIPEHVKNSYTHSQNDKSQPTSISISTTDPAGPQILPQSLPRQQIPKRDRVIILTLPTGYNTQDSTRKSLSTIVHRKNDLYNKPTNKNVTILPTG